MSTQQERRKLIKSSSFKYVSLVRKKIMKHYVPSLGLKDKHCQRRRVKKLGRGPNICTFELWRSQFKTNKLKLFNNAIWGNCNMVSG